MILEKFTFKIPRVAQKVERFYKNIVDDALFGKDPEVVEDVIDPKNSVEVIKKLFSTNKYIYLVHIKTLLSYHIIIEKLITFCTDATE